MKKLILFTVALFAATFADAQIVSSRTSQVTVIKQKRAHQPITTINYVKVGLYSDGAWFTDEYNGIFQLGFSLNAGRQMPLGNSHFYYAIEGGLRTRGMNAEALIDQDVLDKLDLSSYNWSRNFSEIKTTLYNVQLTPVMFGWKPDVGKSTFLDLYAGLWASYDLFGSGGADKDSYEDVEINWDDLVDKKFDVGFTVGAGVWFNDKYYLGLEGQWGFGMGMIDIHCDNYSKKLGIDFKYAF